jgi:dienelactone hydrolase
MKIVLALVAAFLALSGAALPGPVQARQSADAPALAARGDYSVGVITETFTHKNQPDLLAAAPAGGGVARQDRVLPVVIWYPTTKPGADTALARYVMPAEPKKGVAPTPTFYKTGEAYADATPVRGQRFPLVVISPGYRNWAAGFSDLAETLASKGYVVAVIEHHDLEPVALDDARLSFATTVITRVADQRFIIGELTRQADQGRLKGLYDPANIALIGYSMGGFGALTNLGAPLDPNSALYKQAPAGLLTPFTASDPSFDAGVPKGVKALIAFAPWGGTPPLRAWTSDALARVKTPTLVVVGDHDDVAGYTDGVAWIYDALRGADRRMLIYENARHNVALNGVVPAMAGSFQWMARLEEPVWRRDRILAINRHFVTAFLDGYLKGDASHQAYLAVPTPNAADGAWPPAPGAPVDLRANPADPASAGYWPGFQRRWALGLRLRVDKPDASPTPAPRP